MSGGRSPPTVCLDEVGQLAKQRRLRPGPHDLLDDLSALEDGQGRDVQDPVLLRRDRVVVHVQLDDVDLVSVLAGDLLENRRDLAARTAPLGPVVHDDGLLALENLVLEGRVGYCSGCAHGAVFLSISWWPLVARSAVPRPPQVSWSARSASHRSASRAAAQPVPAAVTAWRAGWSTTSPAANTPSIAVRVDGWSTSRYPSGSVGSCPVNSSLCGSWPMATKM